MDLASLRRGDSGATAGRFGVLTHPPSRLAMPTYPRRGRLSEACASAGPISEEIALFARLDSLLVR